MEVDLTNITPDLRHLDDMRMVLADQDFAKTAGNVALYEMYRKLKVENGLRYDITVIAPRMFGNEFVKTKGHIHAGFYGEVYMVLEGEGIYFAQKGDENNIEDVFAVHAKKGDVIIIPAGYGHVTINPGVGHLRTANWIAEQDKGDFSMFEKNQGACYYYLAPGQWVKNEHYKQVPRLRFEEPLKEVPKDLSFLKAR
ncbi:MAG: glucose-6-phosphate isomerase [Candidatus Staskawiczbacteria bacterium]|nr:glucose-6-phosphate isomerase [Candidatus Staskawiczbacteria bacterium]